MKNTTKFAKNAITASLVVGTSLASASVLAKSLILLPSWLMM